MSADVMHNHSQPNGQTSHLHDGGDERHLHEGCDGYLGWWAFDNNTNTFVFHRPAAASSLLGKERTE